MIFLSMFMLTTLAAIHSASGFCTTYASCSTSFELNKLVLRNEALTRKIGQLYMSPDGGGVTTTTTTIIDVANKYFQLEEMEDKDNCISEIFFAPDKSISVGTTDGPIPTESSGSWELDGRGELKMNIKRTYLGGQPKTLSTDIGEFTFEVERNYVGQCEQIGNLLGFSGSVHDQTGLHGDDAKVGFFELIDTTEAFVHTPSPKKKWVA